MAELGISIIPAYSPQAKGRIERLWGVLQNRLVVELRLAGVATIEGGGVELQHHAFRTLALSAHPLDLGTPTRRRSHACDSQEAGEGRAWEPYLFVTSEQVREV
jgi:hypothetical protein